MRRGIDAAGCLLLDREVLVVGFVLDGLFVGRRSCYGTQCGGWFFAKVTRTTL